MAMLLAEAGCVFVALILSFSGVLGRINHICAVKGSAVNLPCSDEHPTASFKWYKAHWDNYKYEWKEVTADGHKVTYNISEENHPTLSISDLTEEDAMAYCCKPKDCEQHRIHLHVTDLQVKVIPTTEGQTVTLMCSTSCPLTEKPPAYIWYKNREFLYQDWSPWYQELVPSEEAVTYSCAIKGYKDLRAPEVSVVSVTPTCFSVTYSEGRMCSEKTPVTEPCSITYPREIHVQVTPAAQLHVTVTCNTTCPPADFIIYKNRIPENKKIEFVIPKTSPDIFSCAVKGLEDLLSTKICVDETNCEAVNYVSRRICALEGSSVNISSKYSHRNNQQPKSWFKIKRNGEKDAGTLIEAAGHVEYHDNMRNHHTLTINNLKKTDSAEYRFQTENTIEKQSAAPGVTLIVTGLKVTFTPSVVTEGQRVTLTCSTSCPLTDNTNYIWYLNSRPLTLTQNQNKHLVLDPVSTQHAGNYSCTVKTHQNIKSPKATLSVQVQTMTIINAARLALALLIPVPLLLFYLCMR